MSGILDRSRVQTPSLPNCFSVSDFSEISVSHHLVTVLVSLIDKIHFII